jgi:uncharacterized membrane protein YgdD (TMEM256/DUF423 family)
MQIRPSFILVLASISGLLAVALGAFAAHGLTEPQAKAWAATAFDQHAFHTIACFAAAMVAQAGGRAARFSPALFLLGIVLFCGSLYALALGAPRALAVAAPIGGVCFMAGWLALTLGAWQALRATENAP